MPSNGSRHNDEALGRPGNAGPDEGRPNEGRPNEGRADDRARREGEPLSPERGASEQGRPHVRDLRAVSRRRTRRPIRWRHREAGYLGLRGHAGDR